MIAFRKRLWLACFVSLALARVSTAQESFATLIENESEVTIDAVPTAVIFKLIASFSGDSVTEATNDAELFEPALRAALKEADYDRATVSVTGPMLQDASTATIKIEGEIRLALATNSAEGTRSTAFAAMVDKINGIATTLKCMAKEPVLDVSDRAEFENKAVQRAIENAFTRSQAAATVMRLEIVSVDRVTIESVAWHDRAAGLEEEVSPDRIGVTVKIRVAYLAMSPSR